jgi:signal peptidase I
MSSVPASTVSAPTQSWVRTAVIGRKPKHTIIRALVLALVSLILFKFVLLPVRVAGNSMAPTYFEGRVNFINRLAYWSHGPKRGDVVAVRTTGRSILYLKRVVALPGETLEFMDGLLLINGQPLNEPYVKYGCDWTATPEFTKLADDEYYVVGDNRSMPFEDHEQGRARLERILGKTVL